MQGFFYLSNEGHDKNYCAKLIWLVFSFGIVVE
jgi:uncharacterized protein YycO